MLRLARPMTRRRPVRLRWWRWAGRTAGLPIPPTGWPCPVAPRPAGLGATGQGRNTCGIGAPRGV